MTRRHRSPWRLLLQVQLQLLVGCCLLLAQAARAAEADVLPQPRQVSPHAWTWIGPLEGPRRENHGFRMNLGFVVGRDAVAVIDSGYSPQMARTMLDQIRTRTPLPVRHVVNTNSQPHRVLGNAVFRQAGARAVAGQELAGRLTKEGTVMVGAAAAILGVSPWAVPDAPERLLQAGETEDIDLGGGVVLRVRHAGQAHTRGSLSVEVRPDRVVFTGDLLYGERLPALIPDGSVKGWLQALDTLAGLEGVASMLLVPGHGRPGRLAEFQHPTRDYLQRLKRHTDDAVKRGIDIETAKSTFDVSPWKGLANVEELNGRNVYQAYQESEADDL